MKRLVKDGYKLSFRINGWEEGKMYFLDILGRGNLESKLEDMYYGQFIEKDDNTFSIKLEDEYGHDFVPSDTDISLGDFIDAIDVY